ncbi:NAD-dependent epimerase/dehydratase family protein [Olsenella profusa]|uniref:NAD(P)H-binding protein, PF13460 family n=1 Tax=Olsenella profusa F0195 TaxID=1125712 RepID=U2UV01_9ACTN|nr:NAD(P)-dependent oxidoreductase [Olsenella profusa]ERL06952.1 NAD(P)H-binding protein, PF13460 family [Olsenella profusa F0195]
MSRIPRVLMTDVSGGMGMASLKAMLPSVGREYDLTLLVRDFERNRAAMSPSMLPFLGRAGLSIVWGDLDDRGALVACLEGCDLVLHMAAFVSPAADYHPTTAMRVNFGGTRNLVEAVRELGQADATTLVYIGMVVETGDRMPPIHWGRVGDPIEPSMFDYYAVSKVAAERYVIEWGLGRWVSLRQTGITGPAMARIRDAIQLHNCLDNVLEYISDRDSCTMMAHLASYDAAGSLPGAFWGHVYNVGGGEACPA